MDFRHYAPDIGRFVVPDPLSEMSQDQSNYSFCINNPILRSDPSGLKDTIRTRNIEPVNLIKPVKRGINWFTGVNVGYTGSGWGHGPRQWIANQLGIGNTASNIFELGLQSQLQANQVNLIGEILNKIKTDPDMIKHQKDIIKILKADPRFKKIKFSIKGKMGVEFGGRRWSSSNQNWGAFNGSNPIFHKETWDVAFNELTWSNRHSNVSYDATVKTDGTIVISYRLSDTLDLSAQPGRSEAYNNISSVTGFLYHDVVGGNSDIKVNAEWQITTK